MTEFVSSPGNLLSILSFVISCSQGVLLCLQLRRFTHERYVVVACIWKLPPWISSPLHSTTLISPDDFVDSEWDFEDEIKHMQNNAQRSSFVEVRLSLQLSLSVHTQSDWLLGSKGDELK